MFAISPTDADWFTFLKDNSFNSYINFWTPAPAIVKSLKTGDRIYFMLPHPVAKIAGYGEFAEYKNLTAEAAWNGYGYRNGTDSKAGFINSIQKYINRNSEKFGKRKLDTYSYHIGCIILKNCEFWEEQDYKDATDYGIDFPTQVVTLKYFDGYDPFLKDNDAEDFGLVREPRDDRRYPAHVRNAQSHFKARVLKAYNNTCCITGETIPELLEAAHIQGYRTTASDHVQNGLLLRVDLHRLFDNNLLRIDEEYKVHISGLIGSEHYGEYHGRKISLPELPSDYPSAEALKLREADFRTP